MLINNDCFKNTNASISVNGIPFGVKKIEATNKSSEFSYTSLHEGGSKSVLAGLLALAPMAPLQLRVSFRFQRNSHFHGAIGATPSLLMIKNKISCVKIQLRSSDVKLFFD